MEVETKFLRLFKPRALGDRINGWRVCCIGGWDKCRIVLVVMPAGNPVRGMRPDIFYYRIVSLELGSRFADTRK